MRIVCRSIILLGLLLLPGLCHAAGVLSDPEFFDGGNRSRLIAVSASTLTPVCISTTAQGARELNPRLGVSQWLYREIVNMSTGCALMITRSSGSYATFASSFGVVLASGSLGRGDSWVVPDQDAVWGIWGPTDCQNGPGAGGIETWYAKPND